MGNTPRIFYEGQTFLLALFFIYWLEGKRWERINSVRFARIEIVVKSRIEQKPVGARCINLQKK